MAWCISSSPVSPNCFLTVASSTSNPTPCSTSYSPASFLHLLDCNKSFHRGRLGLNTGSPLSRACFCVAAKQDSYSNKASQKRPPVKRDRKTAWEDSRKEDLKPQKTKREDNYRKSEKGVTSTFRKSQDSSNAIPLPLPSPPAGFILDEQGHVVLMAPAENRIATIVDPANGRLLECLIRRVFSSSQGIECFLMCPLDTPLQILKLEEGDAGVRDLSDEEIEEVLPTASYELAKRRLHLVFSGFCLTGRGGFGYTEEDIIDLDTEYGESVNDSLSEGVEIANFKVKNSDYLIYTPLDPLMFVAFKDDETGELKLAEDDLLDDKAVLDAIDEEREFQVLVEEEAAVNATLGEADD